MSVPRMRTIQQCAGYFKTEDPETRITYSAIRRWVLDGLVPCVKAGRTGKTYIIDLDLLIEMLEQGKIHPKMDKSKVIEVVPKKRAANR